MQACGLHTPKSKKYNYEAEIDQPTPFNLTFTMLAAKLIHVNAAAHLSQPIFLARPPPPPSSYYCTADDDRTTMLQLRECFYRLEFCIRRCVNVHILADLICRPFAGEHLEKQFYMQIEGNLDREGY